VVRIAFIGQHVRSILYRFTVEMGAMAKRIMDAAEFKARCLRVIDEMNRDREPVTITKRGKPVAVLAPVKADERPMSIWGAMRGTVSRYDDPFAPAVDPEAWNSAR
jgi:prevent-host-death family protein